jgi:hypothetical protein
LGAPFSSDALLSLPLQAGVPGHRFSDPRSQRLAKNSNGRTGGRSAGDCVLLFHKGAGKWLKNQAIYHAKNSETPFIYMQLTCYSYPQDRRRSS